MDEALIGAPCNIVSESASVESGVAKFLDKWSMMGLSRSSSSRRGRARAVSLERQRAARGFCEEGRELTSRPLSSRSWKPASTIIICSFEGIYALPPFTNIRRLSTSSGTISKSSLNQLLSSISLFLRFVVAFKKSRVRVRFSCSPTASQSRSSEATKSCRSRAFSVWKRIRNKAVSSRMKRRRRSSVEEKASRRMKCE